MEPRLAYNHPIVRSIGRTLNEIDEYKAKLAREYKQAPRHYERMDFNTFIAGDEQLSILYKRADWLVRTILKWRLGQCILGGIMADYQEFTLTLPLYSLNTYRNEHFFRLSATKKEFAWSVFCQIKAAKYRKAKGPVAIRFLYNSAQSRYDLDNRMECKFILDVLKAPAKNNLTALGIIPDDSIAYVRKITHEIGPRKDGTIDVIIQELT